MNDEFTYNTGCFNTKILELEPEFNMSFHRNDGETVGKIDWGTGTFVFVGEAKKSAKIFFDFLKEHIDQYIMNETKQGAKLL